MARFRGSAHLFRLFGIDVSLHWSWLVVAFIEIAIRHRNYNSMFFNVLEYVTLFGLVLLHEFGHSLACRSVGGRAEHILLWPLGGVALVDPPDRPGAWLWSVAAGPLVNVVLAPVTMGLFYWAYTTLPDTSDIYLYTRAVMIINLGLLIFNVLPIYPLDGGKILQSLLWFVIGKARSLQVVSVIGMLGAAAMLGLAVWSGRFWTGLIAWYMGMSALQAWRVAGLMVAAGRQPPGGASP